MNEKEIEIRRLCGIVRTVAYEAHTYLKHGHMEKIYENSMVHRLRKLGVEVEHQFPIPVYDEDGFLLGDFFADLFVENKLIVELKACRAINDDHIAQLLGYLRSSRIEDGLLINFGAPRLFVKKFILTEEPRL